MWITYSRPLGRTQNASMTQTKHAHSSYITMDLLTATYGYEYFGA